MTIQKISIPKGMRDFGASEMAKRKYIFDAIEAVFRLYGFVAIQTPSMEMLSVLMGKYGDEGDKLLFRVQNSGQKAMDTPEKGLRYDLTVPFARYVVLHKDELAFPFKRYQIQPVWRADRPQKGRYREFYQCDADIIGTTSLIAETELVCIIRDVFHKLHIPVILKLNNRKILAGIADYVGEKDKLTDITVAIDKLDKISFEDVKNELIQKSISEKAISKLQHILFYEGSDTDKLNFLDHCFENNETGKCGIGEMKELLRLIKENEENKKIEIKFDISLARGLNYYTGTIFEVKAKDIAMGAISGGGRYDNLTAVFGVADMSGVGLSFGADRIYDVMEEKKLFPKSVFQPVKLLFIALGTDELIILIKWADKLRNKGIPVEVYPDIVKIKKSLAFANKKNIPFVAIMGSEEKNNQCVMFKNMETGEQKMLTLEQIETSVL